MAELTSGAKIAIVGILAPAFSERRMKAFHLPADPKAAAEEGRCDFVLIAEDEELAKFEHTCAGGGEEDEHERARPMRGARVDLLVQECLKKRNLRGIIIELVLDPPPSKIREQRVAYEICAFIAEKVEKGRLPYALGEAPEELQGKLKPAAECVKVLKIWRGSANADPAILGATSTIARQILPAQRFRKSLDRKANRYGRAAADVLLVVEFDTFPLYDENVPEIRREAKEATHPFREVWVLARYPFNRCCCVWP